MISSFAHGALVPIPRFPHTNELPVVGKFEYALVFGFPMTTPFAPLQSPELFPEQMARYE